MPARPTSSVHSIHNVSYLLELFRFLIFVCVGVCRCVYVCVRACLRAYVFWVSVCVCDVCVCVYRGRGRREAVVTT